MAAQFTGTNCPWLPLLREKENSPRLFRRQRKGGGKGQKSPLTLCMPDARDREMEEKRRASLEVLVTITREGREPSTRGASSHRFAEGVPYIPKLKKKALECESRVRGGRGTSSERDAALPQPEKEREKKGPPPSSTRTRLDVPLTNKRRRREGRNRATLG